MAGITLDEEVRSTVMTEPADRFVTRPAPLAGRVALVTGVSRRSGIGHAVARRLLDDGAEVFTCGWTPHDDEMPWGADPFDAATLGPAERFAHVEADLGDPDVPGRLVDEVVARFGALDVVVAVHARSSDGGLDEVTVEELDACWRVNSRGSLLLAQAFSRVHDDTRPGGRLVLFTSGQALGPMPGEIAYTVSKGAIHQMTASLAEHFGPRGVTVNTINPGPVDTGYASGNAHRAVAARFPASRWGEPDDVARLVAWLAGDESRWITGQVLNSEGGFRRWD